MSAATRYFQWQYELVWPHLGRRVLEVGCGLGNFSRLLADRVLVVGIDVDPTRVQVRSAAHATSGTSWP